MSLSTVGARFQLAVGDEATVKGAGDQLLGCVTMLSRAYKIQLLLGTVEGTS